MVKMYLVKGRKDDNDWGLRSALNYWCIGLQVLLDRNRRLGEIAPTRKKKNHLPKEAKNT